MRACPYFTHSIGGALAYAKDCYSSYVAIHKNEIFSREYMVLRLAEIPFVTNLVFC